MIKSLIKGAIFGAVIIYVWGVISWMVLPWHTMTFEKFTNEDFVAMVIKENAPQKGIYLMPHSDTFIDKCMTKEEKKKAWHELNKAMKEGPFMFASILPEGKNPNAYVFINYFVIQFIAAWLISYLLFKTSAEMKYWGKVGFVIIIALIASIITDISNWNWWGFSAKYTFINLLDLIIGWFLAGLAIAKVVHKNKVKKLR